MKFKIELRNLPTLRAYMKDSKKTATTGAESSATRVAVPCRAEDKRVATRTVIGREWLLARGSLLIVCLALLVCCCAMTLRAQTETATVSGLITDSQGAIVPGAEVQLQSVARGVSSTTTTNEAGIYVFASVQPGSYQITIRKQGFKQVDLLGMIINVQDHVEQNFKLELGSVSESITVEGNSLNINTTDGSVSTVIDREFVGNIPLNGRSFQDLISLTPGVVTASPQTYQYVGGSGDFSVNGQRTESNQYIVDGISQNTGAGDGGGGLGAATGGNLSASTALGTTQSLLSVDALQEFRVLSSTYSAEYGSSPGGQFSFLSRSGTNSFHGSLFDYLRNNAFDANDWFNNHYSIPQPALRQNDFGGTVGGPVWIPGLLSRRGKTFFFLSYEGLRLTQPTEASLQYVPSVSIRMAAPSVLQPILNAFPVPTGAEIEVSCDNVNFTCPTGQPVGTAVPSGLAPFIKAYSLPSSIDSTSVRLDHAVGDKIEVFLRAAYTPSSSEARTLSDVAITRSNFATFTGGIDAQISNGLNNAVRIGYTGATAGLGYSIDTFGGAVPINLSAAFGTGAYPSASEQFALAFSGIATTSLTEGNTSNHNRQWNATDVVTSLFGHQVLKAGIQFRRISSPVGVTSPDDVYEFYGSAPVLANSASAVGVNLTLPTVPVYSQFSLFGQDEWHITPALTLSAGLRWELEPPPTSNNENKPYPLRGNPADPSTFTLGAKGAPLYATTWTNFAPRLGVAWKVRGLSGRETVIRGGVGIFYDSGTSYSSLAFASVGTSASSFLSNVPLPLTQTQLDFAPSVSVPYGIVYAPDPKFKLPYTIEWSTALEQAIGTKQTLTISYVASSGRRLAAETFLDAGQFNPDFTYVDLFYNNLTSNYQSLQTQFQRQLSHGLQALASYTWSHAIDYGSSNAELGYKRGNADFDVRNNLSAALSWEPHFPLQNSLSRLALDNWMIDGRLSARSGFPVTLTGNYYIDPITGRELTSGLNIVPGEPFYTYSNALPGGREINPMAFESAPYGTQGDAPRNFLRGFGEEQLNVALSRSFHLSEEVRLSFRAEAFNVLNHTNFGNIDPNLGDATFGQATNTLANSLGTLTSLYQQGGARSVQFSLKLQF
jgi:hypothetical protein